MKPWVRNVVGVLCHIPLIYLLSFMVLIALAMVAGTKPHSQAMPNFIPLLFLVHILVMLIIFALSAFFPIWLLTGTKLSTEAKLLWAMGAFMMGPIIQPVLYWLYLRKMPAGPYFFGGPLNIGSPSVPP